VLGGAFDPVHFGHLRCAVEIREQLGLAEVLFVPSANPPHRAPHRAAAEHRVAMLRAALRDAPGCRLDTRELHRDGPSWSVPTLEELRAENPQRSLCMIVGLDAFLGITGWHRAAELVELAHIVVARRPGLDLPDRGEVADLLAARRARDPAVLSEQLAGAIFVAEITQLDIASSRLRGLLAAGRDPRFLLPDSVLEVIAATGCYADSDT
jgi:nicotinate-nucleotide adenylyltransferase